MKILHVIDGRCCEAIRAFAIQQCRALIDLGEEVIVLDSKGKLDFGQIELDESEKTLVSTLSSVVQFPANIFRFSRLVTRIAPDIVIIHQGESHFVAAFGILKSRRKIPLVRFRWDNRPNKGISIPARFVSSRLTAGIGVPTKRALQFVSGKLKSSKIEIFYPGVDTAYFQPLTRSKRLSDKYYLNQKNIVIGLVGRLDPIRGHRCFIEAAKLVSLRVPAARFLIAGEEGSVKLDHLRILTDKFRITDKFIYFDKVDDIRKVYSLCDIGVIATIGYEPISRIALEFMAMGIPIIGTNLNQAYDILAENGIIIPPSEPVAMADAICNLIASQQLKDDMGRKGLTAASKYYTIDQLGKRSQTFFREIISGKNQSLPE
jgi:glycosyltransferase involved in cell wall biosynthesis